MYSISKRQAFIMLGAVLLVAVAAYLLYQHYHQPQMVTGERQQQAETPAGVNLAAQNALIEILQSQLNEAVAEIAELKNKPP